MKRFYHFFSFVFLCLLFTAKIISAQEDIRSLIQQSGTAANYPESNVLIVFDRMNVDVAESGYSETTTHLLQKILTPQGSRDLRFFRFDYDPLTNAISIPQLRVWKQDGQVLDFSESEFTDLPAPQGIIFWGGQMRTMRLPELEVGDAVEYTTIKKGFQVAYLMTGEEEKYVPPMRGHFYDVVYFQSGNPIKEKQYSVLMPLNKPLQYSTFNANLSSSIMYKGDKILYTWCKKDIPKFPSEAGMVAFSDVAPKIVLATPPSWEEKLRFFFKVNEPQLAPNNDIKQKTMEITTSCSTKEEKISTLIHWVAQEIRYIGLTMGKGEGYTVHTSEMTFRDRGGVCKDKAGLLVTMLRLVGIESYVVMTMAGSRVEAIPADQFNHCVTAIRRPDGTFRLLDPTWAPNSRELWSSAEQEQNVVIGTSKGEPLSLSPYSPPEENYQNIENDACLTIDGDLEGTLTIRTDGAPDTRLRRTLAGTPLSKQKEFFEGLIMHCAPTATINELNFSNPEDFSQPSFVRISYRIPNFAARAGENLICPAMISALPSTEFGTDQFITLSEPGQRSYPFRLRSTQKHTFVERVTLPEGFQINNLPQTVVKNGESADFSFWCQQNNDVFESKTIITMKKRTIPAEDFPVWKDTVQSYKKMSEMKICISKQN